MNRTDIQNTEIIPDLYLKRAKEIRNRKIEEVVGGIILFALLAFTFTIVQVNLWRL